MHSRIMYVNLEINFTDSDRHSLQARRPKCHSVRPLLGMLSVVLC
jgi:hypothetical protein